MNLIHAKSDNISRFALEDGTLYIEFRKTRDVYRYTNVSTEHFEGMRTAESIGSYFHKNIKPYGGVKLPREEATALGFDEHVHPEVCS
jgi:hypothetical protein